MLRYLLAVNPLLQIHRGGGDNSSGGGNTSGNGEYISGPAVESVIVSQPQLTLVVNDTFSLNALVLPTGVDASVSWTSSDESVVTFAEHGRVIAKGVGTANVTATAKADISKTAVCKVTVVPEGGGTPATSITLSPTVLNLGVSETKLLSVTVSPDNAVMPMLYWLSDSDTDSIVQFYDGKVTGIREGSTTVTVSAFVEATKLTASCQVTVSPRTGIEGKWLSNNGSCVIAANTITTGYGYDGMNGFVPSNLYKYTKSGNETKGAVTVTPQATWDSDTTEWVTVDTMLKKLETDQQTQMQEQKKILDEVNLGELKDILLPKGSLEDLKLSLRKLAAEMNMTFNENNLTEENLTKPVPEDVKELYMALIEKQFATQKEEITRSRTYKYEVIDDPGYGAMIQFTGMYDTTKKWFEQTEGNFSAYDNGISISYNPQSKSLYGSDQNTQTDIDIFFSSVTETELTERDSGKTWTALWDGIYLTLTNPEDVSYKLEWSGYYLF